MVLLKCERWYFKHYFSNVLKNNLLDDSSEINSFICRIVSAVVETEKLLSVVSCGCRVLLPLSSLSLSPPPPATTGGASSPADVMTAASSASSALSLFADDRCLHKGNI